MNLKNKTKRELWDILDRLDRAIGTHPQADNIIMKPLIDSKYEIHKEIIRKEKDNENTK